MFRYWLEYSPSLVQVEAIAVKKSTICLCWTIRAQLRQIKYTINGIDSIV